MIAAFGAVMLFFPMVPNWISNWICVVTGVLACMRAMPVSGGTWAGMQPTVMAGTAIPVFAFFPLSFSDITRVMWKVNLVRYAAWIPVMLACCAGLAARSAMPIASGVMIGIEVLIVLLSAQWILIVVQHADKAPDTIALTWQLVGATVAIPLLFTGYVGSTICLFYTTWWTEKPWPAAIAASVVGMFFCSRMLWMVFRPVYNRGRIDLMRRTDRR